MRHYSSKSDCAHSLELDWMHFHPENVYLKKPYTVIIIILSHVVPLRLVYIVGFGNFGTLNETVKFGLLVECE